MNESPDERDLDLSNATTKAVDLEAPRRETDATKEGEVKVLLYGRLADAIGRKVDIEAEEGCSVGDIRDWLAARHPAAAADLARSRAFIGDCVVVDDRQLSACDVAEFLPPVSGG